MAPIAFSLLHHQISTILIRTLSSSSPSPLFSIMSALGDVQRLKKKKKRRNKANFKPSVQMQRVSTSHVSAAQATVLSSSSCRLAQESVDYWKEK